MKFQAYDLNITSSKSISVSIDKQANVKLMDPINFSRYKKGLAHKYYGGLAKVSPINITPPHTGKWYLTVDLGGYSGSVRTSVSVV